MRNNELSRELHLTPLINVAGTMTYLGASIVVPEAIAAMQKILPEFVKMEELQRYANGVIAEITGAEAGFITSSSAAAISMVIAGCITKDNLLAIEQLPDIHTPQNEVLVQAGHLVNYGASVDQAVKLTGAKCVAIGQATQCSPYHLENSITERTVAAMYVVSHHVVDHGQLPLSLFCKICHARDIPVIVDAASEYDLQRFLRDGADVVIYSGHKFLGGPTSGIIAGRKSLIRNAWLQNRGIGRGMKVGKESIYGVVAALQAWKKRDHQAVRQRETQALQIWRDGLQEKTGIKVSLVADPTGNPLERCKIDIDPQKAKISAWDLSHLLSAGHPAIIVRDHEAEKGYIYLDPCNLHHEQEYTVLERILDELNLAQQSTEAIITPFEQHILQRQQAALRWPD
ncbi:aminotransferase class V-fold PLP-dependent enzyme [Scandinavium manionii]|uniref:aminotransferase class V-fold PLP-dependent enzyme n=1 Tax=Scandinavium manionii TaxID=2926520 RepID=UPI002165A082|nr:aminotransferase class V-fold PLP-dependent enzyme [Scandinavium manionii]MCS2166375.1 aminotransferase class V-fold PLP-dependent enzyme [Scandinavium manionii]